MAAATLTSIDLLDLDRWARDGFPHEWFAELRRSAPVWRHPSPSGGPGFWVISRHEDVVALGRCPHILSSDVGNGGVTGLDPLDPLWNGVDPAAGLDTEAKMLLDRMWGHRSTRATARSSTGRSRRRGSRRSSRRSGR
ncbi:MAG: hypothetical protein S0880_08670 [Actinomycetota bacterium]|nr:hypothetical protein [Actinomycetota bacterium]